jgi:hypothetical protein
MYVDCTRIERRTVVTRRREIKPKTDLYVVFSLPWICSGAGTSLTACCQVPAYGELPRQRSWARLRLYEIARRSDSNLYTLSIISLGGNKIGYDHGRLEE